MLTNINVISDTITVTKKTFDEHRKAHDMSITIHPVNAESERARIINLIKELRHKNEDKNILIVVPESMTLEYEQDILKDRDGMLHVAIKSVKKLEKSVLDTYGYGDMYKNRDPKFISKSGMIAKIYIIMKEKSEELTYCKTPRISTAEKIFDTIRELQEHGVKSADVRSILSNEGIPPLLKSKFHDLLIFMEALESNSLDDYDDWNRFVMFMQQSERYGVFKDVNLIFAGYDIVYRRLDYLFNSLIRQNPQRVVHLVVQYPQNKQGIYADLIRSIEYLREFTKRENPNATITLAEEFKESLEDYDPTIKYLAAKSLGTDLPVPENLDCITVYNSPNQYLECLHAAQQLIDWHNEGCRWRDMGIIKDANNDISNILPLVLDSAGIPFFMATEQPSIHCSDVYYLAKVVSASYKYNRQDLIDIMKSGYSPLSEEECQRLEIFSIEHGITGSKWKTNFKNKDGSAYIEEMDALRARLVDPIVRLHDELANRSHKAKDQATAIWNYLEETGFYDKLRQKENEFRSAGYIHYADQVRQSWHIICKVLNMIAVETTETHLSIETLDEILTKALQTENLKSIPQTADAVLVDEPRVFVSGMRKNCVLISLQEYVLPRSATLLTNTDKKWLEENSGKHIYMFYTKEEAAECRRIKQNQYRAIMSATDKLCFSSSALAHNGTPLSPDSLIVQVTGLLKEHKPENIRGGIMIDDIRPYGRDVTLEMLTQKLRDLVYYNSGDLSKDASGPYSEIWKKVYAYFLEKQPDVISDILKSMNVVPFAEDLPPEVARRLYQADITSVSELENFAKCPFQHFIDYGIKPTSIRDYSFETDERGIFYHAAMKAYIEKAKEDKEFPNISKEKIIEYFNEAIQPLVDDLKNGALSETTLSRMELAEYVQTVRTSALYVTFWLAETKYMPAGCEITFGKKGSTIPPLVLNLPDDRRVVLSGQIDRLDVYTDETGKTFGRIVDYKSSEHFLDRESVENGISLQLPIYLKAITEGTPDMNPSGALYQHLTNVVVQTDSEDEDEVRKKVLNSTQLSGMNLVTDNEDLAKASGGSVKKTTSKKTIMDVSLEEMKEILENSKDKAIEHAVNIGNGKISIAPVPDGKYLPCDRCKAQNICMIRNVKKMSSEDDEE